MSEPRFLATLADAAQLPDLFKEKRLKGQSETRMAMVGRSNVGKSTLINAILGRRLAQTSNSPGKTRAIHFYLWPEVRLILADLPGYGFAKAGHGERNRWAALIRAYLQADQALGGVLLLLDARHGPLPPDLEALEFFRAQGVAVFPVFSKADTLKTQAERARRKKEGETALRGLGLDPSTVHWVSSKTRDGLKSLAKALREPLT